MLDVGCFSRTLDHVGDHFKIPNLDEFSRLWISLFARSFRTRMEWNELTGRAMSLYSDTQWWSRWVVLHQFLLQFGDVVPFLDAHAELSPTTREKLLQMLSDRQRSACLWKDLAAVVDMGEYFVKATYRLEGDGPLVFSCFEVLTALTAAMQTACYPNLKAVAKALASGSPMIEQQLIVLARLNTSFTIVYQLLLNNRRP